MFDFEKFLEKEIKSYKKVKPIVVFIEPLDKRVLNAIFSLNNFIKPLLLAKEKEVKEFIKKNFDDLDEQRLNYFLGNMAFADIDKEEELIGEFYEEFKKYESDLNLKEDDAKRLLREKGRFGIYLVKCGYADFVVGGLKTDPTKFLRPALKVFKDGKIQNEIGIFILKENGEDRPDFLILGDCGINTTIDEEKLARIAVSTCTVARDILDTSLVPEINGAIISYSNRGSDEGPSVEMIRKALNMVRELLKEKVKEDEKYATIKIDGEIKLCSIFSECSKDPSYVGAEKEKSTRINAVITPNLDLGNNLYHLFAELFKNSDKIVSVDGVSHKIVDLAYDSTSKDIILSIKANILNLIRKEKYIETPKDRFFKRFKILVINPGSTSTKIAFYEGESERWAEEIKHSFEELKPFAGQPIVSQGTFRKDVILKVLKNKGIKVEELDAIAARGGLLDPIPSGTYIINEKMIEHLKMGKNGEHASNLGAIIAKELAEGTNVRCFIVDPVVVDELPERVKITGIKEIRRKSISHALNQIASAKRFAEENGTTYDKINVIVCHMGGGISVGAHKKGRYIDVNNALNGEGPFSPERSGSLPVGDLIELCFSGKYTKQELKALNVGKGGMVSLLGTSDMREIEKKVLEGDEEYSKAFEAMVYQISKEITSRVPAFDGENIDQIILTGGMARCEILVEKIKKYVSPLRCGITVYPGENEMISLAMGALRVLNNKEMAKTY